MSLHSRLTQMEAKLAKKMDADSEMPTHLADVITWFQKKKLPVEWWPWLVRVYAANCQIPVYGKLLPKDQPSATEPQRQFYARYHRRPGELVMTDHAAIFGPWDRIKEQYPHLVDEAYEKIVFGDESTYPPKFLRFVKQHRRKNPNTIL